MNRLVKDPKKVSTDENVASGGVDNVTVNINGVDTNGLTNGHHHSENNLTANGCDNNDNENNTRPGPGVPGGPGVSLTNGGAAANISQAYGGARPKTSFRNRLRNSESGRVRNSDSLSQPVEIRVLPCDINDTPGHSGHSSHDDNIVPLLETRPTGSQYTKRILPDQDISRDIRDTDRELETGDVIDVMEDDCYIYTYIGGTAYLSADLPNSFFR